MFKNYLGGIRRISCNKQHITAIYGISLTVPAYIIIGFSSSTKGFYTGLALYAIGTVIYIYHLTLDRYQDSNKQLTV